MEEPYGNVRAHGEVGIRRVLGNGQISVAGVEVDGLRSDDDHCIAMCVQCLEGIEQCRPRPDKQIALRSARPAHFASSS